MHQCSLFSNNMNYVRNRDKRGALSSKHFAVLMLKIISDCVARITIFAAWMYVSNDGKFSTIYAVLGYYTLWVILVIFNMVLTEKENQFSLTYFVGKSLY